MIHLQAVEHHLRSSGVIHSSVVGRLNSCVLEIRADECTYRSLSVTDTVRAVLMSVC